jgi:hypothetical protein
MLIGENEYRNLQDGWIWKGVKNDPPLQEYHYWNKYVSSVYIIILTFTSVGYGDMKGVTDNERYYMLFTMMFGIVFYGYMLGTIQKLML